ncbi:MAG: ABC transporter permease subunit, partial [Acidimicrobiales bacterium]|nr:ABC transporter permease subunit [Acidimicrobiales bacterium]
MTAPTTDVAGEGGDPLPELYRSGRAKQRRARSVRLAAYAVGLAALVGFALTADWQKIGDSYFDLERAREQFPDIVTIATKNTIIYTTMSFIGGVVLGLSMALLRLSSIRAYRWFASIYIEIFRGLPALLTIIFVGFITPIALGIRFPEVLGVASAGIAALSLVA